MNRLKRSYHDFRLHSLLTSEEGKGMTVELRFQGPEGEAATILLRGVRHLRASDFALENLVDECEVFAKVPYSELAEETGLYEFLEEQCLYRLDSVLDPVGEDSFGKGIRRFKEMVEGIESGKLQYLEVLPTQGAFVQALFEKFEEVGG